MGPSPRRAAAGVAHLLVRIVADRAVDPYYDSLPLERRIELRRPEEVRFFRLVRSVEGQAVRIRELRVVEGSWQVVYEVIGGAE